MQNYANNCLKSGQFISVLTALLEIMIHLFYRKKVLYKLCLCDHQTYCAACCSYPNTS